MKTRFIALIIIGVVLFGSFSFVYALMYDCLNPPMWMKGPRFSFDQCWGLFVNGYLPDHPTWEEYLESKAITPEPQSEIISEGIPDKISVPTEETFEGVFGELIIESEFDDVINYKPVKLNSSEIEFNGQKITLFEIRINANTDIHYLYGPQTMNLNELKNKQDFFDSGGVLVETVYLTNPTGVYQRLANDSGFEIEYLGTVPTRHYLHEEEYNSLLLYPDNQRLVYIQSIADIDKIKQLASSMKLKNDSLNLDDYFDSNWRLLEPTPES